MHARQKGLYRKVVHELSVIYLRIPKENFYRRLRETLDLGFLYKDTKALYGKTGNPSIDPVVFFKLLLTGYLENITSDRKLVEHCAHGRAVLFGL